MRKRKAKLKKPRLTKYEKAVAFAAKMAIAKVLVARKRNAMKEI